MLCECSYIQQLTMKLCLTNYEKYESYLKKKENVILLRALLNINNEPVK
jgi:hypothetical protein